MEKPEFSFAALLTAKCSVLFLVGDHVTRHQLPAVPFAQGTLCWGVSSRPGTPWHLRNSSFQRWELISVLSKATQKRFFYTSVALTCSLVTEMFPTVRVFYPLLLLELKTGCLLNIIKAIISL